MGCSLYYAATSTHPLFLANILEATYLQPPPNSLLTTTDLIACHAIDLQRWQDDLDRLHDTVLTAHHLAAICFEQEYAATIQDYDFQQGDLVLMRNTRIEVTHNKKMRPQYLGLLVVISRNWGGAYILCELDGSVLHWPVAAFRLVLYLARESIPIPTNTFNINTNRLRILEETNLLDNEDNLDNPDEEVLDSFDED